MASSWQRVSFEHAPLEIIDGDRGAKYPKQRDFSVAGYCLFLNAGNVTSNGFEFTSCQFITNEKDKALGKGKLQRHDVVLTTRGTVGNVAYYDGNVPFENIRINSGMVILRPDPAKLLPRYLYLFLRSTEFRDQMQSLLSGSAQPQFPIRDIKKIEIYVPPLAEQRAIAHILGTLDDKIELNRRMNATLEAIARAIFKSWFVDFDPVRAKMRGEQPYGMDAATAALFPDAFEDSELGPIPAGWKVLSLRELFPDAKDCVLTGPFGSKLHAHDYRDQGVPLILVKNINDGHIVEDDMPLVGEHKLPELDRYRLQLGDIVFSRVGAVGRTAYIYPRYVGWLISGQTLRVRVPDKALLNPRYLAQLYVTPSFVSMVENYALGTTRPSLNTDILLSFQFLLPPAEIQDAYARLVESPDTLIQGIRAQNRTLTVLRDALLPKLISGEIRVEEATS